MKSNWDRYNNFRVQKVGLFSFKEENDAEAQLTYQEADDDNKWRGVEALEISWEVRGCYEHINDGGDCLPMSEPITNCVNMVLANIVQSALAVYHKMCFPENYK